VEPLSPVFWQAVPPPMPDLLRSLGALPFISHFYLAGGTALALQLGHRVSVDLDFFSGTDMVNDASRRAIIAGLQEFSTEIIENVDGNLVFVVDGIRTGFFSYGYPLLDPPRTLAGIPIASTLDIGLMKLDALVGRGSRKDFYDLYFLARHIPLPVLLANTTRKFPGFRDFALMALESMIMFDNANRDFQPTLLIQTDWDEVKAFFREQVRSIGNEWFADAPKPATDN